MSSRGVVESSMVWSSLIFYQFSTHLICELSHRSGWEPSWNRYVGAVDTLAQDKSSPNDDIAQQGRLEMERGLAHLRSSKNNEGSFAIGSTGPTISSNPQASTSDKAGAGGTQRVADANMSTTRMYHDGSGGGHSTVYNASGGLQFNTSLGFSVTTSICPWSRRPSNIKKSQVGRCRNLLSDSSPGRWDI